MENKELWSSFDGTGFAAEYAKYSERASKDGEGNEISTTYATKDAATTSAPGLMSAADKAKLDGIAAGADENTIETISANRTPLTPDGSKNVDIPLATGEVDGLLPHGKFPLIPAEPQPGADRVYSFDDASGTTSWQTIVKDYVGDVVLDQSGLPVTGEDGSPVFSEDAVGLWLSYKGTEFGARRAYEDHTGANIHESIEARATLAQVTTAIESALANYGGFVVADSLIDGHPNVQDPSERFIYLYKDPNSSAADPYKEWIYTASHTWDVIGETSVDISNFTHKVANAEGNIPALNSSGDLVDSGVAAASLTNKPAADGGTDLSLVTTGEKYNWNNWKHDANITIPLPKDTIEVKGHLFKYVQIGNLLVTTKNLDIPLGTVGTNCFWFKDDPDTYGDYGMYYKFSALGNFEYKDYYHPNEFVPTQEVYDCIYSQGWRIWTDTDFNNLAQAHGHQASQDNYKAMCSTTGWRDNPQGTNELGFNARPTGERKWNATDSSGYVDDGYYFCMRVIRTDKCVNRISPSYWHTGVGDLNTGASIRLVKDVNA